MKWLPLIAIVGTGGCGGSYYGTVPLGWAGTIPTCDEAEVQSGDAMTKESTGFLRANREGRVTLACKGDKKTDVGVRAAAKLAIEGPKELTVNAHDGYWLWLYDADGEELRFADPVGHLVDWTVSPIGAGTVNPAYCNHPIFSCPDSDFARVDAEKAGVLIVRAQFGGQTTEIAITVK